MVETKILLIWRGSHRQLVVAVMEQWREAVGLMGGRIRAVKTMSQPLPLETIGAKQPGRGRLNLFAIQPCLYPHPLINTPNSSLQSSMSLN